MFFSRTRVIGHRGWPTRHPDNSLAGIREAADVADMVEVDIRRTADGELILSHDPSIGGLEVSATPWPVLSEVDLGAGEGPARLEDVMTAVPELPLDLEVKNLPLEAAFEEDHRLGLDVAARARPGDLVTCFHWPTVDAVREAHPDVATGLLLDEGVDLTTAADWAVEHGHGTVAPSLSVALGDRPALAAAIERNLEVVVWTVNDPETARELAAAGVSGIITDAPGMIRHILRER